MKVSAYCLTAACNANLPDWIKKLEVSQGFVLTFESFNLLRDAQNVISDLLPKCDLSHLKVIGVQFDMPAIGIDLKMAPAMPIRFTPDASPSNFTVSFEMKDEPSQLLVSLETNATFTAKEITAFFEWVNDALLKKAELLYGAADILKTALSHAFPGEIIPKANEMISNLMSDEFLGWLPDTREPDDNDPYHLRVVTHPSEVPYPGSRTAVAGQSSGSSNYSNCA